MQATSKFKHNLALRTVKIMNVIIMTVPFMLCWFLYYGSRIKVPYYRTGNFLIIILFMVLYMVFGRLYDAFVINLSKISEIIYSQFLAVSFTDLIMYIVICLLSSKLANLWPGIACLVGQVLVSSCWTFCVHKWYFKTFEPVPTIIVYENKKSLKELNSSIVLLKRFNIIDTIKADDCLDNLSFLNDIGAIFLCGNKSSKRNIILKECIKRDIDIFICPSISDIILSGAYPIHAFPFPVLKTSRYMPQPEYVFFKRLFDIILSAFLLILTLPISLIVAIAIKAYDGGPCFYKQTRLTKDGKEFGILKFRSMIVDAEKDGVARLSSGDNDSRITPIGRVIRACRMDELPQLLNILKGDMTFVGPRAERPELTEKYSEKIPEFKLRLQAKAGLTGYAQVYGKYNTEPYEKLQMDLMYIAHPSIIEDFKIILITIKILFMKDSTEGIQEGATDALSE
ncbi:MAG: sugar transferase [Solobacterium sp.]|nr:sugar transferase [Solobacterium sp.]